MSQTNRDHVVEPRGIVPPAHLIEWVQVQVRRIGDAEMARRMGITRTPLLRVAAALPVTRGTIAVVAADYEANRPQQAA